MSSFDLDGREGSVARDCFQFVGGLSLHEKI